MAVVPGGFTVTLTRVFCVVSATLVAVTTTLVLVFTLGAVNSPWLEMVPALADQVTAVFVAPWTEAVNCCVCANDNVAAVGLTLMLMPDGYKTSICSDTWFSCPRESIARTLKLLDVTTVGIPLMIPVWGVRTSPGGRVPSAIAYEYGELPPVAVAEP